jgi:hypothetical protein
VTRVAGIEKIAGRKDMLRLTLEPLSANEGTGSFRLDLPQRALGDRPLAAGDAVSARHRPYGIEFAHAASGDAFFLVLADDWHRDLQTRVLTN